MARLTTSKHDVVWNYVGTFMSMAGNFLLLPFLVSFLSADELGLWYVYIALSGFSGLLELGFTSTFSRNIVYCMSGARRLSKEGVDPSWQKDGIDWHLLKTVLYTSKAVYSLIALLALFLCLTLGNLYIGHVASGLDTRVVMVPWCVFVVAITTNLYFLYCLTFLRGLGDVAGENRAKTFSRIGQLVLTALLLVTGFGLIGAAAGYLANGLLLRLLALKRFKDHKEIQDGINGDTAPVSKAEMLDVASVISYTAWRDGVVSIANYVSTQAMTIFSSMFFSLAETGMYSLMLQLATASSSVACVYVNSCLPAWQSASIEGDVQTQKDIVCRSISCYYALFLMATIGILAIVFPILPFLRPGLHLDVPLYLAQSLYMFLLSQHSNFCCFIVGTNRIPYFKSYTLTAFVCVVLSCVFCGYIHMGPWGLVLGQALPQLAYNNWRWPLFVLLELGMNMAEALRNGFLWWGETAHTVLNRRKV